jgi:hypothetical protein
MIKLAQLKVILTMDLKMKICIMHFEAEWAVWEVWGEWEAWVAWVEWVVLKIYLNNYLGSKAAKG